MCDDHTVTIASLRRNVQKLETRLAASVDDNPSLERQLRAAKRWLKDREEESRRTAGKGDR